MQASVVNNSIEVRLSRSDTLEFAVSALVLAVLVVAAGWTLALQVAGIVAAGTLVVEVADRIR